MFYIMSRKRSYITENNLIIFSQWMQICVLIFDLESEIFLVVILIMLDLFCFSWLDDQFLILCRMKNWTYLPSRLMIL